MCLYKFRNKFFFAFLNVNDIDYANFFSTKIQMFRKLKKKQQHLFMYFVFIVFSSFLILFYLRIFRVSRSSEFLICVSRIKCAKFTFYFSSFFVRIFNCKMLLHTCVVCVCVCVRLNVYSFVHVGICVFFYLILKF